MQPLISVVFIVKLVDIFVQAAGQHKLNISNLSEINVVFKNLWIKAIGTVQWKIEENENSLVKQCLCATKFLCVEKRFLQIS